MKQFDHNTAWHKLAKPSFDALPANIRDLYARVCVECKDLKQKRNLDMPWPQHVNIRADFWELPMEYLAQAARVVWAYGHWAPTGMNTDKTGAYWKFANYCDQTIRDKFYQDEPHECTAHLFARDVPPPEFGTWLEVQNGALELCKSTRDMYSRTQLGPATPRVLERAIKDLINSGDTENVEHGLYAEGVVRNFLFAADTYQEEAP